MLFCLRVHVLGNKLRIHSFETIETTDTHVEKSETRKFENKEAGKMYVCFYSFIGNSST